MSRSPWSPADYERKRRVLHSLIRGIVSNFQFSHPATGLSCSRDDAIATAREIQVPILQSMERKYGAETAERYRALIDSIFSGLERKS